MFAYRSKFSAEKVESFHRESLFSGSFVHLLLVTCTASLSDVPENRRFADRHSTLLLPTALRATFAHSYSDLVLPRCNSGYDPTDFSTRFMAVDKYSPSSCFSCTFAASR